MESGRKSKTVSLKVNEVVWQSFCNTAVEMGISKSKLFSDIFFSNYTIDREKTAGNLVELMESVHELERKYGEKEVQRIREAGEKICRSLLIR